LRQVGRGFERERKPGFHMIRHIVFFKFKGNATKQQKETLLAMLRGLKRKIAQVRHLEVGYDRGGKPNSFDVALNALFDNMKAVEAYSTHPEHVKVVEYIKKVCESTVKVDYVTKLVAM